MNVNSGLQVSHPMFLYIRAVNGAELTSGPTAGIPFVIQMNFLMYFQIPPVFIPFPTLRPNAEEVPLRAMYDLMFAKILFVFATVLTSGPITGEPRCRMCINCVVFQSIFRFESLSAAVGQTLELPLRPMTLKWSFS